MPHHKSAEKRVRTNEKSRQLNVANRSRLRKTLSTHRALETGAEAVGQLPKVVSEVDVAERKGIIPKGRANRLKSRLAKAANRLTASGATAAPTKAVRGPGKAANRKKKAEAAN